MSVFHNNALIGAGGGTAAAAAGGATKSLRFNSGDSAYLSKTFSSAGNRKTFTFSCWVKKAVLGVSQVLLDQRGGSPQSDSNLGVFYLKHDNTLEFSGGVNIFRQTTRVLRDLSAWYHVVLACDTTSATADDRVKVYVNGVQETDFANSATISQNFEFSINQAALHGIGATSLTSPSAFLDGYLADIYFIDGSQLDPTSFGAFDDSGVWQAAAYSGTFGTNGFHLLDFANESTVGHDSSGNDNDFTAVNFLESSGQHINAISGTARSGFPFSQMFDGDLNNGALPAASTSYTFTPTTSIPFSTLHIYAYKDSSPGTLKINGTDVTSQVPNHNGIGPNQRTQITGISSPLTSIQNISNGNLANVVFAGLEIDGELLLDKPSEVDVLFDVPTNGDSSDDSGAGGEVSGNYCTLNPLTSSGYTLSNGNLEVDSGSGSTRLLGTIGVSSGKYYFEAKFNSHTSSNDSSYLVVRNEDGFEAGIRNRTADTQYFTSSGGNLGEYSSSNWSTSEIHGFALDCDNNQLKIYKNNTLTATISITAGKTYFPGYFRDGSNGSFTFNFGARAFTYSAPSGFSPLCTTLLPTPTIADGSAYFDIKLRSGFGTSGGTVSGLEFSPDWVWEKPRTGGAASHYLFDTVRGAPKSLNSNTTSTEGSDANYFTAFTSDGFTLGSTDWGTSVNIVDWCWDAGSSNTTIAAGSVASSTIYDQSQHWSSNFSSSNGFASGAEATKAFDGSTATEAFASSNNGVLTMTFSPSLTGEIEMDIPNGGTFKNSSTDAVIGSHSGRTWSYTASSLPGIKIEQTGGRPNPTRIKLNGKILLDSNITAPNVPRIATTARVNTTAGFSVVTYSGDGFNGATIGHGLGVEPDFCIIKARNKTDDWRVYHSATGTGKILALNSSNAASSAANWQSINSTTLGLQNDAAINGSGYNYVAYFFAAVAGYSAFGSYEGNGSTDGPFVHTGFRPRWVMIKPTNITESWNIIDAARSPINQADDYLSANTSNAENSAGAASFFDFTSNGFKVRGSGNYINGSGNTMIYLAFAENPFQANGGLAR